LYSTCQRERAGGKPEALAGGIAGAEAGAGTGKIAGDIAGEAGRAGVPLTPPGDHLVQKVFIYFEEMLKFYGKYSGTQSNSKTVAQ
jgi:hypothetical protein